MIYKVVIPARANSERLPQKNMKVLGAMPLIEYSIEFALKSFPRDDIWVNSNDQRVINFSLKKGINCLHRPDYLAESITSSVDVLKHQVSYFNENKIACDAIVLMQPTNPFRNEISIKEVLERFESSQRNSLATFSVLKHKIGKINDMVFSPTNYQPGQRSQEIGGYYFENGLLYITKVESVIKGEIITGDVYPLKCRKIESTIDIDCLEDFVFAESLLKLKDES